MKKQKQGISLISLIITIIVIIILAAIVIFSGMGTPEKAQLSAVISDIDNVQTAVDQAYYGFYTEKSVAGEVWTKSQFYEAVATGETNRDNLTGTGIVPISKDGMVKMTLPNYEGRSWGVAVEDIDDHTQVGSVVLCPGFESNGKIYSTLLDVQNDGRDTQLTDGIQSSMTVTNVKVTTDTAGTVDAGTSVTDGTTLYISFDASENGTPVTVTPSLPYAVTTNGDYEFALTNASGKTKTHKVSVTNYKVPTIADKVKVGDYVEYIPDTAEYTTDTNNTGYTSAQTFKTQTKDWRVVYKNTETGEVLLTTNGIVNDGTGEKNDKMYLSGIKGYFRGPTELNNICKALYSNSSLGITARSMTIEDLNKACNYTPSEPTTRYAYYPYGTTFEEGETTIEYNGKTYTQAACEYSTAKFYTSDGGGKTDSDGFTYRPPGVDNPVYVTKTYYNYNPSSKNSTVGSILGSSYGWLASPCVDLNSSREGFSVRNAGSSYVRATYLYYSDSYPRSNSSGVRPLVSLGSMLQIDTSDTARDGSTSAKAWKIIKK